MQQRIQKVFQIFSAVILAGLIQSKAIGADPPVANCPNCVPVANVVSVPPVANVTDSGVMTQGKREYWQGLGWYEQLPNGNWQKVAGVSEVTPTLRPFPQQVITPVIPVPLAGGRSTQYPVTTGMVHTRTLATGAGLLGNTNCTSYG